MRQVSKEEFYRVIGQMNCHPRIEGTWGSPEYRSDFVLAYPQVIVGRCVPSCRYDGTPDCYFLPA